MLVQKRFEWRSQSKAGQRYDRAEAGENYTPYCREGGRLREPDAQNLLACDPDARICMRSEVEFWALLSCRDLESLGFILTGRVSFEVAFLASYRTRTQGTGTRTR